MNQKYKNILAIVLILIVIAELWIYNSELNFSYSNIYVITILNLILSIGFIFWHSEKMMGTRILISLVAIGIGFVILFFAFVRDFSQEEIKLNSWEIEKYEVLYAYQDYFVGSRSETYLKLRKLYVFGFFYKDIDQIDLNSSLPKL